MWHRGSSPRWSLELTLELMLLVMGLECAFLSLPPAPRWRRPPGSTAPWLLALPIVTTETLVRPLRSFVRSPDG